MNLGQIKEQSNVNTEFIAPVRKNDDGNWAILNFPAE